MAGSRGYAAASPGVPLWSPIAPIAPLLPPDELRMLDSCGPEMGGLLPEPAATPGGAGGAEMAGVLPRLVASSQRATAAPEGPVVAASGKAGNADNAAEASNDASPLTMPAGGAAASAEYSEKPAGAPDMAASILDATGNSTAYIRDSIQAAADVCISASILDSASAGQASDQCVIRISRLAAVSTAGEACYNKSPRLEEAHSESTEMTVPAKLSATAAANTGLGDTLSIALNVLDSSQAKSQRHEASAAVMPAREAAVLTGGAGARIAHHAAESGPSQASDSSVVPVVGDSDTPRSALMTAPAAAARVCPPKASATITAEPLDNKAPHQLQPGQGQRGTEPALPCEAGAQVPEDHQGALELARSARTLASRAAAAPLSVDHPLVKRAALDIFRRAAIERSTLQVITLPILLEVHHIRLSEWYINEQSHVRYTLCLIVLGCV